MPRFTRISAWLVLFVVIGLGPVARGQDAQQDTQQPPPPPVADAQPAVQPAQDPDTVNEIQQLRAAIDQLQQQVTRLTSAVEELQADRIASVKAAPANRTKGKSTSSPKKTAAATMPVPASGPESDDRAPMTVLVFQDGHRTEARNYAIVGQTLWIYTEQDSKKVPLSELDVAATKSANADRGIVFQVPPGVK